ncbi:hypothetical protein V5N11_027127 [Cardamine amara subsp. amara]|uniref:Prolamin-like domain-containing protein n=1 Tax=Cardamine amara subsp. amara TaxID=228776 RepID=A0ABD1AJC7_CARAN
MEGKIQTLFSTILVVTLFTLLRPGLAEFHVKRPFPFLPGFPIGLPKCWSSLLSVEGCEIEIFKSVLTGKFENIGHACCKAFNEVDAKCWPQMFPLNPFFPPLLKNICSRIIAAAPTHTMPLLPIIHRSPIDLKPCFSSIINIPGCVSEIHKSIFTGKFGNIGPKCCKAFLDVDAKCWPKMFPLNPFFPRLLKNECSRINASDSTHK